MSLTIIEGADKEGIEMARHDQVELKPSNVTTNNMKLKTHIDRMSSTNL